MAKAIQKKKKLAVQKKYDRVRRQKYKEVRVRLHKLDDAKIIEGLDKIDGEIGKFLKRAIENQLIKENWIV